MFRGEQGEGLGIRVQCSGGDGEKDLGQVFSVRCSGFRGDQGKVFRVQNSEFRRASDGAAPSDFSGLRIPTVSQRVATN